MRIAIDITPLKNFHAFRGIGFYTKHLTEALKKYIPQNKYIFFTRGENLPKNIDLVHYPYFDPFFLTLPLIKKKPTIVTVHDLIPIKFADKFPRGLKGEVKWQVQKYSLKGVSTIITDSKASKEDVVKFTLFPKERIYVVPLAPGEEFKKLEIGNREKKIKRKYDLPEKFILYVGDVNWNKNVEGLIKAFRKVFTSEVSPRVKRGGPSTSKVGLVFGRMDSPGVERKAKLEVKPQIKLVLVGKAFEDKNLPERLEIIGLIKKLNLENRVRMLGFIPVKDLVAIYNLATIYIQPSFGEGFGLPCLEAMACGTPVVAANIPVLRQVCGKAAVYVDPYSVENIARGISNILHFDTIKYRSKVEEGLKQVRKFSWRRTVEETVKVYRKVAARYSSTQ